MNSEIEDMLKICPTCLIFLNCQSSEPIINHPIPNQACKKIAVYYWEHYSLLTTNIFPNLLLLKIRKIYNFLLL